MCEMRPNSPASIMALARTAHGSRRFGNGTATQAPLASARSASAVTSSAVVPIGFSIMNGTSASMRNRAMPGMSMCRPSAITKSGLVSSIMAR